MARIHCLGLVGLVAWSASAWGQPPPEEAPDPQSKAILEGDRPDPLAEALAPEPGGLTPQRVAARATATSRQVAAKRHEVAAASAKLDQAIAAYFPRATLGASYTRRSDPKFDFAVPAGTEIPNNVWALTASLEVPLSDYVLRLTQGYAAASLNVEAKELETRAIELQSQMESKIAYFTWIRARGRAAVAELAVAQAERHLTDARATFQAGLTAEADVLRLEALAAQARHMLRAAQSLVRVTDDQLRTAMHLKANARVAIGIDVLAAPPPRDRRSLGALQRLALKARLDRRAVRKSQESLDAAAAATRGSYAPRVSAFANGLYGNPNPSSFPPQNRWDFSWEVGARLTWTINDTFSTIGAARELQEQADGLGEQLRALEDAVRLSVTQAYYDVEIARSAISAAETRERAAEASLEARRRLFVAGRATATEMVDADQELTDARLQRVDAHVDFLIAWARLENAVGRRLR